MNEKNNYTFLNQSDQKQRYHTFWKLNFDFITSDPNKN